MSYKRQPVDKLSDQLEKPGMGRLLRRILNDMDTALTELGGPGAASSSGSGTGSVTTPTLTRWVVNGPYRIGTEWDGGFVVPSTAIISAVWLHRTTPGTAGSTVVDLNANGVTLYTTQANRPTIAWDDADKKVLATNPDVILLTAGDILTMDIDTVETGYPRDVSLILEAS